MNPSIIAIALPFLTPSNFAAELRFRTQEIDATFKVGYGVMVAEFYVEGPFLWFTVPVALIAASWLVTWLVTRNRPPQVRK